LKTGKIYKHIRALDTAIKPLHIVITKTHFKVKCLWLNVVNPNNVYLIGHDNIKIKVDDINNWVEIFNNGEHNVELNS
jgi:hypothetical protein